MDNPETPPFTVLGPDPEHTDQCIADAAKYGFCEHSMIGRRRPVSPPANTPAGFRRAHPLAADLWGTAAIVGLVAAMLYLADYIAWWKSCLVVSGIGLAWILLIIAGLPRWTQADLSKTLPPRRLHPPE